MAAAIGVPDEERTETIKAFIVLRPGAQASEALVKEIQQLCRTRLAKHEYPKDIEFVPSLPMTVTGKVMRRVLRQQEIERRAQKTVGA